MKNSWLRLSIALGLALVTACNTRAGAEVPGDISAKTELARPAPRRIPAVEAAPTAVGFSVLSDLKRKGGVEENGALVCRKDKCPSGIVAYGPYTRAVPPGPRVATFRVRGEGVSKLDRKVAHLDVYDALNKQRLALRPVKGSELPDGQDQDVELAFTAPAASKLEFRIGWMGHGELRMYRVDVR